jgi:hypothetical protein
MVGSAIVDLDTLKENPAKWLGKLVPNILLAVATGGAGTTATVLSRAAVFSARFGRLARVGEKLNKVARVAMKVDKVGRADKVMRNVGLMKPLTRAQQGALSRKAGVIGEDLSAQKWTNAGYRPVAEQVSLKSPTARYASGKPVRARVDHVFADDGSGSLFGVEAKNGLSADLSKGQRQIYPEMRNSGVEVRSDSLRGEGYPVGSTLKGDVHVDHWYSPADAISPGKQAVVQVGAQTGLQTVKGVGSGDLPPQVP